jgi:serine/threonine protein phosphatase PrpC
MVKLSKFFALNEIGGRQNNEDSIWPIKGYAVSDDRLFMVCDGVGSSNCADIASSLTCESFALYFKNNLKPGKKPDTEFINNAQFNTLDYFRKYITEHAEAEGMSTTLTLAYFGQNSVVIAWCGDSRIMQIRNGEVIYRTTDHSLVAE